MDVFTAHGVIHDVLLYPVGKTPRIQLRAALSNVRLLLHAGKALVEQVRIAFLLLFSPGYQGVEQNIIEVARGLGCEDNRHIRALLRAWAGGPAALARVPDSLPPA